MLWAFFFHGNFSVFSENFKLASQGITRRKVLEVSRCRPGQWGAQVQRERFRRRVVVSGDRSKQRQEWGVWDSLKKTPKVIPINQLKLQDASEISNYGTASRLQLVAAFHNFGKAPNNYRCLLTLTLIWTCPLCKAIWRPEICASVTAVAPLPHLPLLACLPNTHLHTTFTAPLQTTK
jgi:hypothetical protein